MAEAILDRMLDGGHVVVEAPTGVGKTLAYLVAAVLSGRQVVISTNTKNLQDQIIDKDLPLLGRMLSELGTALVRADADAAPSGLEPVRERPVRYALMKGRSNYLCVERLSKKTQQHAFSFVSTDDVWSELNAWRQKTIRGDRAELPGLPERSPIWDDVDARSEICQGTRCASYDQCFVVRMRKEAEQADLVVVNHHLLMADLALKAQAALTSDGRAFGSVIPDAACLILDEAHSIEETASMYFGGSVSNRKVERFTQDVQRWVDDARADTMEVTLQRAVMTSENLLNSLPLEEGRIQVPTPQGAPAQAGMRARFGEAHRRLPEAVQAFDTLAERLEAVQAPTSDALARRARDLAESFRFVLSAEDGDYVYWSERQGKKTTLGAAPVRVGPLLSRFMFARFDAVALTSATLSAGKDQCQFFMESVGAPEETEALVLDSPFDYASQAALYLPNDAVAPSTPQATQQLVKHGESLINAVGGGAMFLFTSHRQMRAVYDRLAPQLPFPVFVQGDQPKRALLKALVDQAPAVLFATMSFWEGVDIPGDPLRLVLIDKLPFDAPDDPLVVARGQTLAAEGKSPFAALQLPRAILRLKQGFGRLVRGHADRGIVAILDRRVQSKGYGRQFLRALPDTRVLHTIEDVQRWWRDAAIEPGEDDG
ncbi:MAG: ATP-dependent DNA helicase [Myxococcota bacterium]